MSFVRYNSGQEKEKYWYVREGGEAGRGGRGGEGWMDEIRGENILDNLIE